jgi:hypothetical protein
MIEFKNLINKLVEESEEFNKLRSKSSWVTKKRGKIICKSDFAQENFKVGSEYTPTGKFYPLVPSDIFGKRTVFKKEPIIINSEKYYLELKGYGRNGKELYFQEHESGDVFYGMYLDLALQEFERMEFATKLNLPVVLPIAVIQIPREVYLKKGLVGFRQSIASVISLGFINEEKLENLIGKFNREDPEVVTSKLISHILRTYPDKPEEGIEFVLSQLDSENSDFGVKNKAKVLLSKREVGYLIRASKCPIRVGDPTSKKIATPYYREIAKKMGYTFRVLLENGYLHYCPGTGNWTVAGELTDFADTFNLRTEESKLKERMEKVQKTDIREFLKYLIGPEHTGILCSDFILGMYREKLTLKDAVERTLKYF